MFYILVLMTSTRIFKKVMMIWNYSLNQKMYGKTNKKVLGKFKSETFGISDFCGLKPKC